MHKNDWSVPTYLLTYVRTCFTRQSVYDNDRRQKAKGWADPEDVLEMPPGLVPDEAPDFGPGDGPTRDWEPAPRRAVGTATTPSVACAMPCRAANPVA